MQSRLRRVVAAYVIALLLIFAASAFAAKNVRKLTLRNLHGNKARLGDYQGRLVVLNFWASRRLNPLKTKLVVVLAALGLVATAVSLRAHHAVCADFASNK